MITCPLSCGKGLSLCFWLSKIIITKNEICRELVYDGYNEKNHPMTLAGRGGFSKTMGEVCPFLRLSYVFILHLDGKKGKASPVKQGEIK